MLGYLDSSPIVDFTIVFFMIHANVIFLFKDYFLVAQKITQLIRTIVDSWEF